MNSITIKTFSSFIIFLLLQVFIFNQVNLFGYINPMLYVLFLINYRFDRNQTFFLFLGFFIGFFIDLMSQTGGAHTIASLTVSFLRPLLIRNAFGVISELPKSFKNDPRKINRILFLFLFILTHHLTYFIVIYFSWDAFLLIISGALITSFFSIILVLPISFMSKTSK